MSVNIDDYQDAAEEQGFSLKSKPVTINPKQLEITDLTAEWRIRRYAKILRAAKHWPSDMPLVVFGYSKRLDDRFVFDGNHRTIAAIRANFKKIPALEIDYDAWAELSQGIPRGFWVGMLADQDRRLAKNWNLADKYRDKISG